MGSEEMKTLEEAITVRFWQFMTILEIKIKCSNKPKIPKVPKEVIIEDIECSSSDEVDIDSIQGKVDELLN
jgi:hypothetical protein